MLRCVTPRNADAQSVTRLAAGCAVLKVAVCLPQVGAGNGQYSKPVNPLTPNDPYRGRTAPLTSKVAFYVFIKQIQVLSILNMVYTLRFFLFKMQFVS